MGTLLHDLHRSAALSVLFLAASSHAQAPGSVVDKLKIADGTANFPSQLSDGDAFGRSLVVADDLDGDGVRELVVGAPGDDDGAVDAGALWVLFLNPDGTVRDRTKISAASPALAGALAAGDGLGSAVASIGDLDGDGVGDLAAGLPGRDDGGPDRGSVLILFLDAGGAVTYTSVLSGFQLADGDAFGTSVASLPDLDGDGARELAVGAVGDDGGGVDRGALWIVYLASDGSTKSAVKIDKSSPGFLGVLDDGDAFGASVASSDSAKPGSAILAVGAPNDDDGGPDRGAVLLLVLDASASIKGGKKVNTAAGVALLDGDRFGSSVVFPGDIDDDGTMDLAVGAPLADVGGPQRGAVHVLFMNTNGSLHGAARVSSATGLSGGLLADGDELGSSLAAPGDLNGDTYEDLIVGACFDDTGGPDRGATWVTWLIGCPDASTSVRVGTVGNPTLLFAGGVPVFQTPWSLFVDCTGFAPGEVVLVGSAGPAQGIVIGAGEILIDLSSALYFVHRKQHTGALEKFTYLVPSDPAFCSFRIHSQAIIFGSPGPTLTNAVDWIPGR